MRYIANRLAWALAVAMSLLVLTLLTGGVRDGPDGNALASDSHPGIAISGQGDSGAGPQQVLDCSTLGLPWATPAGDDDCDGFSTTLELHVGTVPLCAAGLGDEWAADLNNDGFSDGTDITILAGNFGKSVLGAPVRQDIGPESVGDGFVDGTDITAMAGFFGKSAAAFLPTCPP